MSSVFSTSTRKPSIKIYPNSVIRAMKESSRKLVVEPMFDEYVCPALTKVVKTTTAELAELAELTAELTAELAEPSLRQIHINRIYTQRWFCVKSTISYILFSLDL